MHEAAISQSIVKTVLTEAKKQNAKKVQSVEIEVGELTFLNSEQVAFWVKIGFQNTMAENAKLIFKTNQAIFQCSHCQFQGPIPIKEDPLFHMHLPSFACPQCQSSDLKIIQGKEALIRRIKIIKN